MAILGNNYNYTTIIVVVIFVFFLMSCSFVSSVVYAPRTIKCEDNDTDDKKLQKRRITKYF